MSVFDICLLYNISMDNIAFKKLLESNDTYIIHYASNGIYEYGSLAPKISCIAVWGTNNEVRRRFFVQDFLEGNSLEQAEKIILQRFADFLSEDENIKFIHWGMNADGFGFRAISARCSDLGVNIREIPSKNKIDLSKIVSNYAGKKLSIKQVLMMNNCISEDFLSGKEEVECYNNGKYEKVFNSVKDKVVGFNSVIQRIMNNDLLTEFGNRRTSSYSKEKQKALEEIREYREQFFKNRQTAIQHLKKHSTKRKSTDELIEETYNSGDDDLIESIETIDTAHFIASVLNWFKFW